MEKLRRPRALILAPLVLVLSFVLGGTAAYVLRFAPRVVLAPTWRPGRVQVADAVVVPLPQEAKNKSYEAAEALRFSAAVEAVSHEEPEAEETEEQVVEVSEDEKRVKMGGVVEAGVFGMYQPLDNEILKSFRGVSPVRPGSEVTGTGEIRSYGTAVLLDADRGVFLTCLHVVRGADEVVLHIETPEGGKRAPVQAVVTARSEEFDLALLKTESKLDTELRPAPLQGSGKGTRVGDPLLVVGNPYGAGLAVSFGFVAALGKKCDDGTGRIRRTDLMDVRVAPGFSGGAVVNLRTGRVVGVCSASVNVPINSHLVQL